MSKWLCVDPGDTTGWSVWDGKDLVYADQTPMWEFADNIYEAVHTDSTLGYLAGLIDGEGTIGVYPNGKTDRVTIQVSMTAEDVLKWCAENFGGTVNGPYRQHENRTSMYTWKRAARQDVADLIAKIRPLLKLKASQADDTLTFLKDEYAIEPSVFIGIKAMVVEQWQLYPWELQNLAWDHCRTARLIGALELICRRFGIELIFQGADIKEAAIQAGAEALFLEPVHENRHANDSLMHGTFYIAKNGGPPA